MFADDECDSVGCQSTTIRSKSRCTYSLVSLDRYAESAMESHIVRNCSFAGWIVRWSHPTPYLCDAFYYALAAAAVSGAAMDCYHSRWHSSGSVTLTNTAIPIAIRLVDGSPLRRYLRIPKILRTLAPLCRAKPSGGHLSRFSNFGQKRKKKWFSNASSVIENRVWIHTLSFLWMMYSSSALTSSMYCARGFFRRHFSFLWTIWLRFKQQKVICDSIKATIIEMSAVNVV